MSTHNIHVAVGVILNDEQKILIALRSSQAHQGGLWEFPGGKVERGETVQQALSRELAEELNIQVIKSQPLLKVAHDYGDKTVLLDVWWVNQFDGDAIGCEGQPILWVEAEALNDYSFPEANHSIVNAVQETLVRLPQSSN